MKTLSTIVLFCILAMSAPAFAATNHQVTTAGSISTVSTASITVSVSATEQKTYKISKRTKVKLDSTASTADKLSAGMGVTVTLSSDRSKDAKEIDATTAKAPAAPATPAAKP